MLPVDYSTNNIAFLFKKKRDPASSKGVGWNFFYYLVIKFVANEQHHQQKEVTERIQIHNLAEMVIFLVDQNLQF